jgi:hypothetical protein
MHFRLYKSTVLYTKLSPFLVDIALFSPGNNHGSEVRGASDPLTFPSILTPLEHALLRLCSTCSRIVLRCHKKTAKTRTSHSRKGISECIIAEKVLES